MKKMSSPVKKSESKTSVNDVEMTESPAKDKSAKKEKRQKICEQMEFYFSDSNLSKDRFLKQEITFAEEGCKQNYLKKTF